MKKIVLSTVVASSLMFGANVEPFVGLDVLSVKAKPEAKGTVGGVTGVSDKYNFKDTTFGIKAGAIIDDNHRTYFSYMKASDTLDGEKSSYSLPAINYDYLIKNDKLNGFIPYVGAHIGYGKTKFNSYLKDKSSVDYGLNLGVIKDINEKVSLEVGYRYTYINSESSSSTAVPGAVITGKNKDAQAISFGINYKF